MMILFTIADLPALKSGHLTWTATMWQAGNCQVGKFLNETGEGPPCDLIPQESLDPSATTTYGML